MASGFLALLDDIATVLDDVAVFTKVAAKKTSGVIGDDLALNAEQVNGVSPNRELPIIWAVAKGGIKNKVILVPLALLITAFAHWLVTPLLMIGGGFLCFEGVEKVLEKLFHSSNEVNPALSEEEKIKGAIRTDFILSAEIIIISLGAITSGGLLTQFLTLCIIAIVMTVGIYGLVALIIRLDDMGLKLLQYTNVVSQTLGKCLVQGTPYLMKTLGVVGTLAMFLVGGGIVSHGISPVGHAIENFGGLTSTILEGLVGVVVGLLLVGLVKSVLKIKSFMKVSQNEKN